VASTNPSNDLGVISSARSPAFELWTRQGLKIWIRPKSPRRTPVLHARAAAAFAQNADKSDRAIAADIGVSHTTAQKARASTGNRLPVGQQSPSDPAPAKRVSKDGKARRPPDRRRAENSRGTKKPMRGNRSGCHPLTPA
jgi:hypothetical protein